MSLLRPGVIKQPKPKPLLPPLTSREQVLVRRRSTVTLNLTVIIWPVFSSAHCPTNPTINHRREQILLTHLALFDYSESETSLLNPTVLLQTSPAVNANQTVRTQ